MNSREKVRVLADAASRLTAMVKAQHGVIEAVIDEGIDAELAGRLRSTQRDTDAQLAAVEDQLRTALAR